MKILLVVEPAGGKGPQLAGTSETVFTFDLAIDGSATEGTLKMTTKANFEGDGPLGTGVTRSVEGTEERSVTPVN